VQRKDSEARSFIRKKAVKNSFSIKSLHVQMCACQFWNTLTSLISKLKACAQQTIACRLLCYISKNVSFRLHRLPLFRQDIWCLN